MTTFHIVHDHGVWYIEQNEYSNKWPLTNSRVSGEATQTLCRKSTLSSSEVYTLMYSTVTSDLMAGSVQGSFET